MSQYEYNVKWYPTYVALFNAFFWAPVFFLFLNSHVPLADVLVLESFYYGGMLIFEVPSGYFSDRLGRRRTLIIANVAMIASYGLFAIGNSFVEFAVAELLLALAVACNSGTDTAFHFSSLAAVGRRQEFGDREAKATRNAMLSLACSALCGGLVTLTGYRMAYLLSLTVSVAALTIALSFHEPPRPSPRSDFVRDWTLLLRVVKSPATTWLISFSVCMTFINHIPHEFYQPYLGLCNLGTPSMISGLHMAFAMLIGSFVAQHSMKVARYIGTHACLLLAMVVQNLLILLMAFVLHPVVALLLLLRVVPRGLATAPLNDAMIPLIPDSIRATVSSLTSLFGRLCFGSVLLVVSMTPAHSSPESQQPDWIELGLYLRLTVTASLIASFLVLSTYVGMRNSDDLGIPQCKRFD